ncbi:MAG: hypothetical protein J1E63_06135, partial [Muribaculaceae bacterium]|nr:hypothetical protein [Muribaculaceae bacterium]
WLLRRLDTIKEKIEYLPTLYYELAMNLSDDFDYVKAMEMVEELVDLEPMKAEFWELYAEIAYRMVDFEKTVTGADFALAINAESRRAALLKGAALLMRGEYREGRQLIGNLYLDPNVSTPHTACLLAASYDDDPKKAVKILTDFLDTQSVLPQEPVTMLAQIDNEASLPYIKQYIRENAEAGETHFLIWADEFSSIGADDVVGFILDQYDLETFDVTKSPSFYDTMYYSLYKGGRYMRVIKKYGEVSGAIFSPIVHIAYVLSVFRIGGASKALDAARETWMIIVQARPYSNRYLIPVEAEMRDQYITRRLDELISTFKTAIDTGVAPDISKIDPFYTPTDDAGL